MFDPEYAFGTTMVYCDRKDCNAEMEVDGFDGHCLPFADVAKEIKEYETTQVALEGGDTSLIQREDFEL